MNRTGKVANQKIEHTMFRVEYAGSTCESGVPWFVGQVVFDWGGKRIYWTGTKAEEAVRTLKLHAGTWVKVERAWLNVYEHANKPGEFGYTLRNATLSRADTTPLVQIEELFS